MYAYVFSVLAGIIPLNLRNGGHFTPFAPPPCLQGGGATAPSAPSPAGSTAYGDSSQLRQREYFFLSSVCVCVCLSFC